MTMSLVTPHRQAHLVPGEDIVGLPADHDARVPEVAPHVAPALVAASGTPPMH